MAVMIEMHHTGCVPVVRSEIVATIEHALADRPGDWRVLIIGSQANDRWEMRITGPSAFERSYTLEGSAGRARSVDHREACCEDGVGDGTLIEDFTNCSCLQWCRDRSWPYLGLRFSGVPIANRKIALLPFACGEKKFITSSSKKVSPVEPRRWAYAAKYILPPMAPASSWTAR